MARTLDVYLHRNLVGHLTQTKAGQVIFQYSEDWLRNPNARPLSYSLPLRKENFKHRENRGFFSGILPEESKRELVAQNLGISANNDFAMLEQIGRECAGAVTFMPAGQPLSTSKQRYRDLNDAELVEVLRTLPRRPLLAGDQDVRLSLAGAQNKVAVKVSGDQISIPLDGAPSTHILKPVHPDFPGLVFNEVTCLQLASAVGLQAARAEARSIEGLDYALIARYDRKAGEIPEDEDIRLHQEDFCQALGLGPERKYQSEGGPSLKQCFELIREVSSAPVLDLERLLDAIIFNYLIGNHDAHGKNFSLLYRKAHGEEVRLAPLYDLVCTLYYPELSKKMAMRIGDEYMLDKITPRHFEQFAEASGLARPLVRRRVPELAGTVVERLRSLKILQPDASSVAQIIRERCEKTIAQFLS